MLGATRCPRPSSMLRGFVCSPAALSARRAHGSCRCLAGEVEPPNVAELCQKARLAMTPKEMEDLGPKIRRVVEWFAQLQDVDVDGVSPAIGVGGEAFVNGLSSAGGIDGAGTLRSDVPSGFGNREAMLAAIPDREGPYLKVPKVLKENIE
eukprot:TRINITY_DN4313_c0_g1_i1.p1 TRINITY_DN4313_c0_g1~~TRINITY_DN4313_c0_g1_i1.p1  ORF type:complete len:167 (-),score=13.81 TRINITY_DN4313_c0_g1_i1:268-720(-)